MKKEVNMKKLNLLLLIVALSSCLFAFEWTYSFEQPIIKDGTVTLEGCEMNYKSTDPSIAIKPVKLLLPYMQTAKSITVIYSQPITMSGEYDIKPVSVEGFLSTRPENNLPKYSSVYMYDDFYPAAKRNANFTMQYKNGHPILISVVYPVQYNPQTKKVQYYQDITIKVETEYFTTPLYKHNAMIARNIKALCDNKEMINSYSNTIRNVDDYDYLIVTDEDRADYFIPFIEFNLKRGLKTKIATIESFAGVIEGEDLTAKIRNFIRAEYEEYSISYVLLGGDEEIIPHRGLRSEVNDYGTDYYDETDIAADMYFACLDGTWQLPGSQYYGEFGSEDLMFEVYAARFAIETEAEFTNLFNKLVSYSNSPINEGIKNNLLVGEHLWGPPDFPTDSYGSSYMNEFLGECTANDYTTQGFTTDWQTQTLYDIDFSWNKYDLLDKFETHKPTWIDHLGHSNVNYNMRLMNQDIKPQNFINDGVLANYFILYSQGCYSGAFDNRSVYGNTLSYDCIGELFTTISKAAVAYVGNSRYGIGSPYNTDGSGQRFHRYFHDALFNENIYNIEAMNAYSKEVNAPFILEEDINLAPYYGQCKWIAYTVNVLGDPALDIWTEAADSLIVNAEIEIIPDTDYIIQTQPYASIVFTDVNRLMVTSGIADEDGYYNLYADHPYLVDYIAETTDDEFYLYIKAHNFYPYEQLIHKAPVSTDITQKPTVIALSNYPNPFNPETKISFELNKNMQVTLDIYNAKGQKVTTLISDQLAKGKHTITWNGKDKQQKDLSSGIYFYRLSYDNKNITKKMLLLK